MKSEVKQLCVYFSIQSSFVSIHLPEESINFSLLKQYSEFVVLKTVYHYGDHLSRTLLLLKKLPPDTVICEN